MRQYVFVLHTLADDDAGVADDRVPADVQLIGPLHDALPLRRALYVVEPAPLARALRPACCTALGQKGNSHDSAAEQISLCIPHLLRDLKDTRGCSPDDAPPDGPLSSAPRAALLTRRRSAPACSRADDPRSRPFGARGGMQGEW